MTTETLMTDAATTTTEGQAASQQADPQAATAVGADSQQQQATQGQTTEAKQGDGGKTEGEQQESKPQGAPEKYDFKPQEGQSFDDGVIGAFSEVAKELNLPQDAAQKVLDKMGPVLQERQMAQVQAASTEWAGSAKADKEFGGDKLPENLALAKQALDTFGTPELRTLLEKSGLGNHPEVIRVFYRTGKAISEDRFVGGKAQGAPESVAQRMYPNMNP